MGIGYKEVPTKLFSENETKYIKFLNVPHLLGPPVDAVFPACSLTLALHHWK